MFSVKGIQVLFCALTFLQLILYCYYLFLFAEFAEYLGYARGLDFFETPDYDYCYGLFKTAFERDQHEFDWAHKLAVCLLYISRYFSTRETLQGHSKQFPPCERQRLAERATSSIESEGPNGYQTAH